MRGRSRDRKLWALAALFINAVAIVGSTREPPSQVCHEAASSVWLYFQPGEVEKFVRIETSGQPLCLEVSELVSISLHDEERPSSPIGGAGGMMNAPVELDPPESEPGETCELIVPAGQEVTYRLGRSSALEDLDVEVRVTDGICYKSEEAAENYVPTITEVE